MLVKPVCVKCQCFYRPKKNGYDFMEGKPDNNHLSPEVNIRGTRHPEVWTPYKLWHGDLWECPDCESQIVIGCMGGPVAEHYQSTFAEMCQIYPPQIQVNDC